MRNIDKQALRDSAESTIGILENIAGFEPSDIDGDAVELRFETEDGFDTGCDVSIVDQCHRAADVVRALLDALEAAEKRIAELEESHAQVIHSRDHYKRIAGEGIQSLAEARTLTVKLQGYAVREGHPINEGKRGVMFPKDGGPWFSRFDVEHALHIAGIQLKVEE